MKFDINKVICISLKSHNEQQLKAISEVYKLDFDALEKSLQEEDSTDEEGKSEVKAKAEAKAKVEKPVKNVAPKGDTKSKGKSVGTIRKMA